MSDPSERPEQVKSAAPEFYEQTITEDLAKMGDGANSLPVNSRLDSDSAPFMASTTSLDPVLGKDKADGTDPHSTIKLSGKRWLVLFAMTVFGLSIALSSDTSPILSLILNLLDLRIDSYIYISQIFYYLMAIMAIPTAWFVDEFGIKKSIYAAAGLYVLNCTLKALLYSPNLPGWHAYRMYYFIIGGFIATQVNSIFFLLPLKVSETWFSASERSVAWTIMISQLELGVCISSLIYPRIMHTLEQIELFAYINLGALVVTTVVCLACVTRAAPEHPPSERMAKAHEERASPFWVSIKRMVTNKDVVLHLVHLATFESCSMSISSVLQAILTSAGHSKIFAGNFMSINAFASIVMLIIMASFVHRITNMTLTCKLSSGARAVFYVAYLVTLIQKAPGWAVVIISIVLTIFKCWTMPNFNNMTAHLACGLVSQATIIGFSITLTLITMTVIQVTFASLIVMIDDKTSDYTQSLIFLCIVCVINEAIYQVFFQGKTAKDQRGNLSAHHNHQDVEDNPHIRNGEKLLQPKSHR